MRLLWLADVLRHAGLTVHEVDGWRTRGADSYGPVRGITIHGTGSGPAATAAGDIRVLLTGSPTAPAPIAQLYLARDGAWHVVAAGTCFHNLVGWAGPNEGHGNDSLLGIEAAHSNRAGEPWPATQYQSYVRGVAALARHKAPGYDVTVARVAGHREHQPGDKVDPTFDMDRFRRDVQEDDVITDADADRVITRLLARKLGRSGPTVGVALQSGYAAITGVAAKLPMLDQILAAAQDDGDVTVQLPAEYQQALADLKAAVEAIPDAVDDELDEAFGAARDPD